MQNRQQAVDQAPLAQFKRLYDALAGASNSDALRVRRVAVLWLLVLALASIAAGPPIHRSGDSAFPEYLSPGQIDSLMTMKQGPEIEARAAAVVDRASTIMLWARNEGQPLPMASTTKLMTVLLALETLSPDQIVTVPAEAIVGNASMGLQAGDRVSVRALIYGALLPSGNDAAMTLALATAGTVEDFVALMNQRAAEWGLNETHFANPHGLDAPRHVSSARDLVALARRALENPLIAEVVATPQITIEGYSLTNTNQLLTTYAGTYGVKTGTTDAAGQVLIAGAARPGGDALAVVMNSPDRFSEVPRMLDFYFDNWQWVDIRLDRDALNKVTAPDGSVYALRTVSRPLFLPKWQVDQLRGYRAIGFDLNGEPAGVYQVWLGEDKLVEIPIDFYLIKPGEVSE